MFNINDWALNPITFAVLVLFLVQFIKDLGVKGNVLRLVSLGVGAALAVIFELRVLYPAWAPWIEVLFFSLFVGLGACGMYSFFGEMANRIGTKIPTARPSPEPGIAPWNNPPPLKIP